MVTITYVGKNMHLYNHLLRLLFYVPSPYGLFAEWAIPCSIVNRPVGAVSARPCR